MGRSWINTSQIARFDDDAVLLVDGDASTIVLLETTCRDFQQYINTKRHERVTYIGD